MGKIDKKIILESLKKNPTFEKEVINKLKNEKGMVKKLKISEISNINKVIDIVKGDVRKRLESMGEEIEQDFEKELYDKIDDLIEDDYVFFQNLDDPDKKRAVVNQLIKELT